MDSSQWLSIYKQCINRLIQRSLKRSCAHRQSLLRLQKSNALANHLRPPHGPLLNIYSNPTYLGKINEHMISF